MSAYSGIGTKYLSFGSVQNSSQPLFFQPKLTINPPNDVYEQEADAVADKVMQSQYQSPGANTFFKSAMSPVQRTGAACETGELQQEENNNSGTTASTEHYLSSLAGGKPLSKSEPLFFEPALGYDFGSVQLHICADASAKNIQAKAYTQGNHIVFAEGEYQPGTQEGKKLLAHELTHVVQQATGIRRQLPNGIENTNDISNYLPAASPVPSIQRAVYKANANYPDSENCWAGSGNKPDLTKTVALIAAEMTIPDSCIGEVVLRTSLQDVTAGGATTWKNVIKFGSSDGTEFGSVKNPTGRTENMVFFEEKIPLSNCTLKAERYHYVRLAQAGMKTFVEVAYKPEASSNSSESGLLDASSNPAIRVEPYAGLIPSKQLPPPPPEFAP